MNGEGTRQPECVAAALLREQPVLLLAELRRNLAQRVIACEVEATRGSFRVARMPANAEEGLVDDAYRTSRRQPQP